MPGTIFNFGRNVLINPDVTYRPTDANEIIEILNRHKGESIRAIGSLHAWSPGAATEGVLLQMDQMVGIQLEVQGDDTFVHVGAGCKIKRLLEFLAEQGLTLPSLGLIDEQTVSGATATGTHGSGKNSLSHYVESVSIAHYDSGTGNAILTTVEEGIELKAARCSMGLMGVVVSLKFRCRPAYNIQESAQVYDSIDEAMKHEDEFPQQQFYLLPWAWKWFVHQRVETPAKRGGNATLYRAYWLGLIDIGLHVVLYGLVKIIKSAAAVRFFYQSVITLVLIRDWKVVDDSHDMLTMQHELFRHIEIELFVQRSQLEEAFRFVTDIVSHFGGQEMIYPAETHEKLDQIGRSKELGDWHGSYVHHYPICCRRVVCDDTLISMSTASASGEEDWYAISLISYHWPKEREGFFNFADFIGPATAKLFNGRCHWGKYNPLDRSTNRRLYPEMDRFLEIKQKFDPDGVFTNQWLQDVI